MKVCKLIFNPRNGLRAPSAAYFRGRCKSIRGSPPRRTQCRWGRNVPRRRHAQSILWKPGTCTCTRGNPRTRILGTPMGQRCGCEQLFRLRRWEGWQHAYNAGLRWCRLTRRRHPSGCQPQEELHDGASSSLGEGNEGVSGQQGCREGHVLGARRWLRAPCERQLALYWFWIMYEADFTSFYAGRLPGAPVP
jgi:hypothetical protein